MHTHKAECSLLIVEWSNEEGAMTPQHTHTHTQQEPSDVRCRIARVF